MLGLDPPLSQNEIFYRVELRYNILGSIVSSLIKFKHMITLTNKTIIMLSFPSTIKFSETLCLNLIRKRNISTAMLWHLYTNLTYPTQLPKKRKEKT